ncbi:MULTISPECIES: nuclease A inhibitor family protein [Cyanophyceae]
MDVLTHGVSLATIALVSLKHNRSEVDGKCAELGRRALKEEKGMNDAELINTLEEAIAGLQWMSESDYPFTVVYWQDELPILTPEHLLQLTNHPPDTLVETEAVDDFFAIATQAQDWHDAEATAVVKRYQALVETLKQSLDALTVYRLGQINLDLYIIGKTTTGALAGLATQAVET